MLSSTRTFFRFIRKLLSIIATILFLDLLLRIFFIIIFFLMLPFFILHDHVVPSILMLGRSTRPIVDPFFGRVLPSLFAFVLSLLPPVGLYYATKYVLVPVSIQLYHLAW